MISLTNSTWDELCLFQDTPLPDDIDIENKESKVMYNWFDATTQSIGYISITDEKYRADYWLQDESSSSKANNPTRLIQFMGIDNVPFHSILFLGSLLGTS